MAVFKLDKEPKTPGQVLKEAGMAQRLLNDEVFGAFLEEITNDIGAAALHSTSVEEREYFRVQYIAFRELQARIESTAHLPEEIRQQEERATLFE